MLEQPHANSEKTEDDALGDIKVTFPLEVPRPAPDVYDAICRLQNNLETVPKNRTAVVKHKNGGQHTYKYADLSDVWKMLQPCLYAEGLAVVQAPSVVDNMLYLRTAIHHPESATCVNGTYPIGPVSMPPQEAGAAMSYARRYSLCSLLGIVSDEDVDAGSGTRLPKAAAREIETELRAQLNDLERNAVLKEEIADWITYNEDRIEILPQDWETLLRADARTLYKRLKMQEDIDKELVNQPITDEEKDDVVS